MGLEMEYIDGQTPLSEEEKEGLIITSISTKKELDEYEQKNIEDAGKFRNSNKNLGVEWWKVPLELKQLLDDTKFWINNNTFSEDEIAIRFKHRIVAIHCFANGNGRHSRLMADVLMEKVFKKKIFTWGNKEASSKGNINDGELRVKYLKAIKADDNQDLNPLLEFARS